jgi:hypothetical protein
MNTSLRMTAGRRWALGIGAPLALALIGWSAVTEIAWAGQGSYPVSLTIPVRVNSATVAVDSGDVRVGPGAGNVMRLTGTAHYSIVRSRVTQTSTASGVTVRSECRFPTGVCNFDYQVALPADVHAILTNASGDETVHGLSGRVDVSADSGDIHADALAGRVTLTDHSGDITGSALSGPQVVIKNDSGNIVISGLNSRDVSATDKSGDVTLTFTKVPASVRVLNDSGNVTIVLPPGTTTYNVSATAESGSRTVRVPTSSLSPHVITVTAQSGDVSIRQ